MKTFKSLLASVLVLFALAGCDDHSSQQQNQQQGQATPAAQSAVATSENGPVNLTSLVKRYAAWGVGDKDAVIDASRMLAANYYVVFDGSGSMGDSGCSGGDPEGRIAPARRAMIEFVRSLPPDANLGLFVFDASGVGERVPLGHGDANRNAFVKAVGKIKAGNDTPLGTSLASAIKSLSAQASRQNGYGEYHIVVVTDGEATDGDMMDRVVSKIVTTPVVLETVGLCIPEGHALNKPGQTVYRDAKNPDELRKGLASVLAESNSFASVTSFQEVR